MADTKRHPSGTYNRTPRTGETRLSACQRLWEPVRGSIVQQPAMGQTDQKEPGVVVDYRQKHFPAKVPEDIEVVTLFRSGRIEHFDLERFHREVIPTRRLNRALADYGYVDDATVNSDYMNGRFDAAFSDDD